jgi:hypothetical protein
LGRCKTIQPTVCAKDSCRCDSNFQCTIRCLTGKADSTLKGTFYGIQLIILRENLGLVQSEMGTLAGEAVPRRPTGTGPNPVKAQGRLLQGGLTGTGPNPVPHPLGAPLSVTQAPGLFFPCLSIRGRVDSDASAASARMDTTTERNAPRGPRLQVWGPFLFGGILSTQKLKAPSNSTRPSSSVGSCPGCVS